MEARSSSPDLTACEATDNRPGVSEPCCGAGSPAVVEHAPGQSDESAECAFRQSLLQRARLVCLPELFAVPNDRHLYHRPHRHGVGIVATHTRSLTPEQMKGLLIYRLAQYLCAGLVDPVTVYRDKLEQDLMSSVSVNDIHIIAGEHDTGQILCYVVLRTVSASPTKTMRSRRRPRFPVERAHDSRIYNRLPIMPDLLIRQVVELSRFVKNHQLSPRNQCLIRSPAEIGVALYYVLCRSTCQQFRAVIGDLEETVAKRNLDFFHVPTVLLAGCRPISGTDGFLSWAAHSRAFAPFAFLVEDFVAQRGRVHLIEEALELPGTLGIRKLIALKKTSRGPRSTLSVQNTTDLASTPSLPLPSDVSNSAHAVGIGRIHSEEDSCTRQRVL